MRIAVGHQVSEASAAWLVHWVLLKGVLWVLGIPGAIPFLELAAYAGYAFVPVCVSMIAGLALGELRPGSFAGCSAALCIARCMCPGVCPCLPAWRDAWRCLDRVDVCVRASSILE